MRRTLPHPSDNPTTTPAASLPTTPTESRPHPQEPAGPLRVRVVEHPDPYALRGMPVWCTKCRAKRDWVFINQGRNVWVSCRCGHTWHEPELTRADYDTISIPSGTTYPTVEAALEALGFDGTFQGVYLG